MPPDGIIKYFDVLEDALPGLGPGAVFFEIHELCCERMKERLHDGIIVAIAGRAHTL